MATFLVTMAVPEKSGAPLMALQYFRALQSKGHSVVLACGPLPPGRAGIVAEAERLGVVVVPIPAARMTEFSSISRALADIARRHHADCIIGLQLRDRLFALSAARRAALPCIIMTLGRHTFTAPAVLRWMFWRFYGWSLRHGATAVGVASPRIRDEVLELGVARERVQIVPNGIDTAAFEAALPDEARSLRERLGIGADEVLFVSIGRLDPLKGQDVLVEAFAGVAARDPAARLVIVGTITAGPTADARRRYANALRTRVQELSLERHVTFVEQVDDVKPVLAAADVYVHPSRSEGWPLALVEAMATGRLVVFTDCAGPPIDFQQGVHGFMVATDEPDALRAGMLDAIALGEEGRRRVGSAAQGLARRHYDVRVTMDRFLTMAERAVAST